MKKKIISLILATTMVLSPTTTFASDTTNSIIYTEGVTAESFEQSVAISASKGGEFVVAVPKVGNLDNGVDMSLKVGIYADIASDKKVVIAPVDSTPDDTPDVCNFTIKNIVPIGFVGKEDIHGVITTKKTDFLYNDTDICTNKNDITNPENMVEILTYRADYSAGEWTGTITLNISLQDYAGESQTEAAGLYDANGVMLCSWEDSGIDVTYDYDVDNYGEKGTSGYCVLRDYPNTVKIVIPNGITKIGNYAFCDCGKLESVVIPNSVTSIGDCAFSDCNNLTSITFKNTNNWYLADSTGTKVTDLNSSDLSNVSTAATYLSDTYLGRIWICSVE